MIDRLKTALLLSAVNFGVLAFSNAALASETKENTEASAATPEGSTTPRAEKKTERNRTEINFGETMIEGQMKAPDGFFLQGRNQQSMSQMVRLRSHFRSELGSSRAGVRYLSK